MRELAAASCQLSGRLRQRRQALNLDLPHVRQCDVTRRCCRGAHAMFDTIKNGVTNTAMSGYAQHLSDRERFAATDKRLSCRTIRRPLRDARGGERRK